MDKNKLLAILVGGVAAFGAVAFFAGNAQAASWHDYSGDIYAGHAYGLIVPANAKSYEISLAGDENATARVAAFGPDGAKLGFYALSTSLPSADIVAPAEGRHAIYVYDLSGGALKLRVDAQTAPPAALEKIDLVRNDVAIGDASSPQKFDKSFTTRLSSPPVFATLLYDGSVQGLDATVASAKGNVVTISHESGTAFSPGVWSSLSGERASTPENLDGSAYTVTVHAQKFEGSMVLTTLGLRLTPPSVPAPSGTTDAKPPASPVPPGLPAGSIVIPVAKPIAFVAAKGAITLEDAKASIERSNGSSQSAHDTISIYAPDDTLVKFVTLDGSHPNATVVLPVAGEYVAFVQHAGKGGVVAYAQTGQQLTSVRELKLRNETVSFVVSGSSGGAAREFALAHVPVALRLAVDQGDTALLGSATIRNDQGVVAEARSLAQVPGAGFLTWSYQDPAHFAAGAHTLDVSGVLEGKLTLTSFSFVRYENASAAAQPSPTTPGKQDADGGPGDLAPPLP